MKLSTAVFWDDSKRKESTDRQGRLRVEVGEDGWVDVSAKGCFLL